MKRFKNDIRESKGDKIDILIDQALNKLGYRKKMQESDIVDAWPETVGKMVANRTTKMNLSNGKLYVKLSSSIVKNELLVLKPRIIKSLNTRLGEKLIDDIIFF